MLPAWLKLCQIRDGEGLANQEQDRDGGDPPSGLALKTLWSRHKEAVTTELSTTTVDLLASVPLLCSHSNLPG